MRLKWKDEARTRQREVKIRGPWIQRCIDNSLTQFILFSTPLFLLDCGGGLTGYQLGAGTVFHGS